MRDLMSNTLLPIIYGCHGQHRCMHWQLHYKYGSCIGTDIGGTKVCRWQSHISNDRPQIGVKSNTTSNHSVPYLIMDNVHLTNMDWCLKWCLPCHLVFPSRLSSSSFTYITNYNFRKLQYARFSVNHFNHYQTFKLAHNGITSQQNSWPNSAGNAK